MHSTLHDLISLALAEDLNIAGDITSQAFIPSASKSSANIISRNPCTISGIATAIEVFYRIDPDLQITHACCEGDSVSQGAILLAMKGSTRSLLLAERTALNFLGRLCGIATLARRYADEVLGTGVQILDTRKTTPGWRTLEKQAVRAGGCMNHRIGLYDGVLVKDNHLASLKDHALLPSLIQKITNQHKGILIGIEAESIEQLEHFLPITGIGYILLDNMPLEMLREAVRIRNQKAPKIILEASGGITLQNLRAIASTGVDRISVGALTHSAMPIDLSMEFPPVFTVNHDH